MMNDRWACQAAPGGLGFCRSLLSWFDKSTLGLWTYNDNEIIKRRQIRQHNHNDNNNVNSGDDGGFPRHPTSSLSLGQRWVSDIMGSLRFYSLIVGLSVAVYWIFISLVPVINKYVIWQA